MPLSLADAQTLVSAAHAQAAAMGIAIAVAVLDEGGHLIALARMDGAFALSSQIAEAKALGAAVWYRDGESLLGLQAERPAFFEAVDRLARRPLIPGAGSLVIRRDGVPVGGVGVSGASSDQDLECAQAGVRALEWT